MKRKFALIATAIVLVASASILCVCVQKYQNDLFNQNVEALSQSEIVVGDLCMMCPNYACSSLGEVFLDHYPA